MRVKTSFPKFPFWRPVPALPLMRGHISHRYRLTALNNLAVLNWEEDFLKPFREKTGQGGYIGLGKTLEALTRMAAGLRDRRLLELRRQALDTLSRAQSPDGYLGTYRPDARIKKLWDVHELSYVIMALLADWQLFQDARSLRMARRIGHYLLRRLDGLNFQGVPVGLELITLGLDRAMIALYHSTGDRDCLDFLNQWLKLPAWRLDIVLGRHGSIAGHAYAYLTRCLAQLELYAVTGDRRLVEQTLKVVRHLLNGDGLLITGACGLKECWNADQAAAGDVGETCATAYLIRMADRLARVTGDGRYADLAERAVYNALFAAQSPDGRKLRYYTPLLGARVYWHKDTYCCPGNFRRIVAELPGLVYHCRPDALRVNLFEDSTVCLPLAGAPAVAIRQQTKYPADGRVALHIQTSVPADFELQLRVPAWCDNFRVAVNGKTINADCRHGYAAVKRLWRQNDRVDFCMDMPWRLVAGTKNQAGRVAVMRGPLVYCANPAANPAFSPADFTRIKLDARSLKKAPNRTDGQIGPAGRVKAAQVDPSDGRLRRGWLYLTEFADPAGQCVYFT